MENSGFLFEFLKTLNPTAFESSKKIEESIYIDPQSSCSHGRITLEEIINDVIEQEELQQLRRSKLYDKISYLDHRGYLTKEIVKSMDIIRSIGNQASHNAGYDDIENAIKVFKATYSVAKWYVEVYSLDPVEIPPYRNPKPINNTQETDHEELINKILSAIKGGEKSNRGDQENKGESSEGLSVTQDQNSETETYEFEELGEGQSYLLRELKKLQESSQEAVESPEGLSKLKDYLHVDRKIQTDLEYILENEKAKSGPSLVLLSGSVGDGKSHLLSYLKSKRYDLIDDYKIYNDATESSDPQKSAIETLSEELEPFSDEKIDHSDKRLIIAINLGILNNFLEADHGSKSFNKLKAFVQESGIFDSEITAKYSRSPFHIISFSDYKTYELTRNGPQSQFFSEVMRKVFEEREDNPFYKAYKLDVDNGLKRIVHENYEFLMSPVVQKHVIQLIINTIIQHKLVISARALFNLIADLIIPKNYNESSDFEWGPVEKLEYSMPNLLFARQERSSILNALHDLDPVSIRHSQVDDILISFNTLDDWDEVVKSRLENDVARTWMDGFLQLRRNAKDQGEKLAYSSEESFSVTFIRTLFLFSEELFDEITPESYKEYTKYLYDFNVKNEESIKEFYQQIRKAVFDWKGSPKNKYVYLSDRGDFKVAQQLNLRPDISHLKSRYEETLHHFEANITTIFNNGNRDKNVSLTVDYYLYKLIRSVLNGYCPNKKDEEDAIQFVDFMDKVMKFGNYDKELLVHIPSEKLVYRLEKDEFGGFVFERE